MQHHKGQWFPRVHSSRLFFYHFHKTSSRVTSSTSAYHVLSTELLALCSQNQLLFSKILTWSDSAALSFLPAAFCFACLKTNLPFFWWCISGFYPHHGWNKHLSEKWIAALLHTLILGNMSCSCIVIFMPRISFSLWQMWNPITQFTVYFRQVPDSGLSKKLRLHNLQTHPFSPLDILFVYLL